MSHRAPAAPVLARRATSGSACQYLTPRFPVDMYTPPPKRVDTKEEEFIASGFEYTSWYGRVLPPVCSSLRVPDDFCISMETSSMSMDNEHEHFTLAGVAWRLHVLSASKDIKKPSFAHSPVAGPGVCNGYYFIYVSPPGSV